MIPGIVAGGRRLVADGDPDWASVVLLMHMDGSDNGTTFTDQKSHTVTRSGSIVTKTNYYQFGTASAYFDAVDDYLILSSSADWNLTSGDFTIEFFARPTGSSLIMAMSARAGTGEGWEIYIDNLNYFGANGVGYIQSSTACVSRNSWAHYAWVRQGSTNRLYYGGTQVASGSSPTISSDSGEIHIGKKRSSSQYYFSGHIDEVRITKGVCRYPDGTTFTPPSAAFPDN